MNTTTQINELIQAGALFVINHSGGKDSQVMMIKMLEIVPKEQILVVHATLGEVEWPGALEHAQQQADAAGVPFIVAEAVTSFMQMVERKHERKPDVPSFPSASQRQCTSDLKRGPIEREIRRFAAARGIKMIVNCMGLRAQESPARRKLDTFKQNTKNSVAGRSWFDWLPIHEMLTVEVFAAIADAGQEAHWAYAAGNDRLSCVFCIMGIKRDLVNGAKHNPELFARMSALEERTGYTLHMSRKTLATLIAEAADPDEVSTEEPCDLF